MNKIIPLNLNKDNHRYFKYPQIDIEYFPINFSLYIITNPSTSKTFNKIIVIILEEIVKISSKILIYLTKILQIPKIIKDMNEEIIKKMIFTIKELEILESITKKNFKSTISTKIDDIHINTNPKTKKITEIINLRYINPHHQIFYFIKINDEKYY
jgi:hypothetical protein